MCVCVNGVRMCEWCVCTKCKRYVCVCMCVCEREREREQGALPACVSEPQDENIS